MALKRVKDPKVDLKLKYRKILEFSFVLALLILIFSFYAFKKFDIATKLPEHPDIKIEMLEIPPTQQLQRPPPPSRPLIPVESEDDDFLDDEENMILTLYYFDECSVSEITQVMNYSKSNIKIKLFRARKKLFCILRTLLKDELESLL